MNILVNQCFHHLFSFTLLHLHVLKAGSCAMNSSCHLHTIFYYGEKKYFNSFLLYFAELNLLVLVYQ